MNTLQIKLLIAGIVVALGSTSCALFSKSTPIAPRFFSPERPSDIPRQTFKVHGPATELRLGRIGGASYIEEMLVFRDTASEIGYYRLRRWTEAPQHYLKRRLARVLFEERGLQQVVGGSAPTLDVQLTAFEETLFPQRMARVQVIARLHDERIVRWEETVTVDLPVIAAKKGDTADAAVEAIGRALRATVDRIADRVILELAALPAVASQAKVSR